MADIANQTATTATTASAFLGARVIRSGPLDTARAVLRADAAVCAVSGLALVAAATPLASLASLAGGEPEGAVRFVGAILLVIAVDFALLSRVRVRRVATAATIAAAANVGWVGATAAVIAAGLLEPGGIAVALAGAVVTAAFAWEELAAAAAVRRSQELVERISA